MTHPDPNQCPCTTGRDSFDGLTLLELGAQAASWRAIAGEIHRCYPEFKSLMASDEDGHLEVDDWYRRNSEGAP